MKKKILKLAFIVSASFITIIMIGLFGFILTCLLNPNTPNIVDYLTSFLVFAVEYLFVLLSIFSIAISAKKVFGKLYNRLFNND